MEDFERLENLRPCLNEDAFAFPYPDFFPCLNDEPLPDLNEDPFPDLNDESFLDLNDEPLPDLNEDPFPDLNDESFPDLNDEPLPDLNEDPLPRCLEPGPSSTLIRKRRPATEARPMEARCSSESS